MWKDIADILRVNRVILHISLSCLIYSLFFFPIHLEVHLLSVGPPPLDVQPLAVSGHVSLHLRGRQLHDVVAARTPPSPPPPPPSLRCSSPTRTSGVSPGNGDRSEVNERLTRIFLEKKFIK